MNKAELRELVYDLFSRIVNLFYSSSASSFLQRDFSISAWWAWARSSSANLTALNFCRRWVDAEYICWLIFVEEYSASRSKVTWLLISINFCTYAKTSSKSCKCFLFSLITDLNSNVLSCPAGVSWYCAPSSYKLESSLKEKSAKSWHTFHIPISQLLRNQQKITQLL